MRHLLHGVFDFFSPRPCLMCGKRLSVEEEHFCAACDAQLPRTDLVSHPFDNEMIRLFMGRFPVNRAAAWLYYATGNRTPRLIYAAKYGGDKELCFYLGQRAAQEMAREMFFDEIDCIVPIPLTRWRRWQRGYNQSLEIARGVHSVTGIAIVNNAVRRVHFTRSQTQLRGSARRENVADAFRLVRPDLLRGKHVLLLDDVCTTGSTLFSCATAIAAADDVLISYMALCRTRAW